MSSTEVATQSDNLPALASTPATSGFDSSDVSLPRLYKGETQSNAFKDDLVPKGCIFVASGGDDPYPEVILEPNAEEGVLVHFVSSYKGKSANVDEAGNVVKNGGEFTTWAFDDPSAPADANVDYHYNVVLPDVDPEIPVKVTFAKTSVPTAKRINLLLMKAEAAGKPIHSLAFRLSVKSRESSSGGTKYQWYIWQAKLVEAEAANIEVAAKAAELVAGSKPRNDIETTAPAGNGPAI